MSFYYIIRSKPTSLTYLTTWKLCSSQTFPIYALEYRSYDPASNSCSSYFVNGPLRNSLRIELRIANLLLLSNELFSITFHLCFTYRAKTRDGLCIWFGPQISHLISDSIPHRNHVIRWMRPKFPGMVLFINLEARAMFRHTIEKSSTILFPLYDKHN